jgi:hypothetical protein
MRLLPDWQVDGTTPARLASASGVGNRARASPISASSPSGANGAGARQAGEHLRVGVRVQLLGDLVGQHGDLRDQRATRPAGDHWRHLGHIGDDLPDTTDNTQAGQ